MLARLAPLALLAACAAGGPDDGAGPDGDTGPPGDDTPTGQWPPGAAVCATADPDQGVIPAVEPTMTTFEGFDTVWSIPEGARGLMFYFIGGSSVGEAVGPEQLAFQELLLTAGVGWVATSRTEPGGSAKWNMQEDRVAQNEDLARLSRLRDHLLGEFGLPASTPIVSSGFSDGGAMSLFFARVMADEGWPVAVVLPHNAGSQDPPSIPTFFSASEHDEALVRNAATNMHAEFEGRGVRTALRLAEERAVTPPSLRRVASWDDEKTQEVFDDLVAFGLIDGDGARLVDESQMDGALRGWSGDTLITGAAMGESRVRVLWATHRYNGLYSGEECAFAMEALGF